MTERALIHHRERCEKQRHKTEQSATSSRVSCPKSTAGPLQYLPLMKDSTLLVAYLSTMEHRAIFLLRTYEPNQDFRLETTSKTVEEVWDSKTAVIQSCSNCRRNTMETYRGDPTQLLSTVPSYYMAINSNSRIWNNQLWSTFLLVWSAEEIFFSLPPFTPRI